MNIYAKIILATLVLNFVLELVADLLNLRALHTRLPAEVAGLYDRQAYEQSQLYTQVKTRFGQVVNAFDLGVLLLFWFGGGFNTLDMYVRGFHLGTIWTGLAYIALLALAKFILALPFSIYGTFGIEARFGFNRTTPRTFILDLVKGVFLSVAIGGPLLAGLLYLFQFAGPRAWLYGWVGIATVTLILQFVAPTWIMPLFNKFTPLSDGSLKDRILSYAKEVGFSLANVFVVDGSKRSAKANAFFTGFGKHKRIALFDTLLEKHGQEELLAILAHEIGHYKKKHILQGMVMGILHMGFMLFLLGVFLRHPGLFAAFKMENISVHAGLIFFSLLFTPVELLLSLVMHRISRGNEYEADRFAVQTTRQGEALITALKTLSQHNLANLTPHPFYVWIHYSHPPLLARLTAIRAEMGYK